MKCESRWKEINYEAKKRANLHTEWKPVFKEPRNTGLLLTKNVHFSYYEETPNDRIAFIVICSLRTEVVRIKKNSFYTYFTTMVLCPLSMWMVLLTHSELRSSRVFYERTHISPQSKHTNIYTQTSFPFGASRMTFTPLKQARTSVFNANQAKC